MESTTSRSAWLRAPASRSYDRMLRRRSVDVIIIGGGITGMTAAALLKERGQRVLVLEAQRIAGGATGHSSAHLTTELELGAQHLIRTFDAARIRALVEGRRRAIDLVAALADQHRIACGFSRVPGWLYAADERQLAELRQEVVATERVDDTAVEVPLVPYVRARGGVRFDDQAIFDPVAFVRGLAAVVDGDGSAVCENSPVIELHDGQPCVVRTPDGEARADAVIIATHTPLGRSVLHTELAPYRSYVMLARPSGEQLPPGLFWDLETPYHYIRGWRDPDGSPWVVVGGADHKTGQRDDTRDCYHELETWARHHLPIGPAETAWSTMLFESIDGLPYVGASPGADHLYVATGFGGDGLSLGALSAMLLADELSGRIHPLAGLLSPKRLSLVRGGKRFLKENANVALHFFKDRLARPDVEHPEVLEPGEGGLIELSGRKVAAYRDPQGELHQLSPVCTHMKCIVQWNQAEKSWDCPCHGARYAPTGEVLSGPTLRPLARIEEPRQPERAPEKPAIEPMPDQE